MKKWLIVFFFGFLAIAPARAAVLRVFSDDGISGTDIFSFPQPPAGTVFLSSTAVTAGGSPEGNYSMLCTGSPYNGWAVVYQSPQFPTGLDLSAYASGELRFWVNSTTTDLQLSFEHLAPGADCDDNSVAQGKDCFDIQIPAANLNQWVLVALPMSLYESFFTGVNLTNYFSPFEITATNSAAFYVDDVRFTSNVGAPLFNVTVNNVSDQSTGTNLTFPSNLTLPAQWVRSNQYMTVEIDPYDQENWGIQLYTDNTSAGASPKFTGAPAPGNPGSNPAGLVDASSSSLRLPLAWSVNAGTMTAVSAEPAASDPNNASNPASFLWFYMQDRVTPAISAENTHAFSDGDPFNIPINHLGIQYAQSASDTTFGASHSPNYIFLESNFSTAVTPRTYQTSTLRLEFFTQ